MAIKLSKNKGFRGLWLPVLFILVILVLAGVSCSPDNDRSEEVGITFAYQDRVADAASIIAVKKGFFAAEGLTVRPMIFASGPACTEALVYGNADFGTMGDSTAIITTSKGSGFRIIASHAGGEHRHRLLVASGSGIMHLHDLEGKRIAVKKGSSTHGGLELLAHHVGLDLSDEIIDLAPRDQLLALAAGEVDAIVASEPTPSKAEVDGIGRELATLGGLGNNYPIFILVNAKFSLKHPDLVAKMLKVLSRATIFIAEYPEEAVAILAAQSGLAPEVIRKGMGYHQYTLRLDDSIYNSLGSTSEFLQDIGKIGSLPVWDEVIDPRHLQALKGE